MSDEALATLIFVGNAHFKAARWWVLAAAWIFGCHRIVRHLGREGRVSFWRGTPYLLTFRETGERPEDPPVEDCRGGRPEAQAEGQ